MDNSFHRQGSDTRQQGGFFAAGQQLLSRFANWLAGFFKLTETEQNDAGIYLDDQRYK